MLAEDDPVKMEMDIVDEQLDTTARTFMGLTVGCARCHDHKFDPIPQADYYSLAGIFKSSKTMENFNVVAQVARVRAGARAGARKAEGAPGQIEAKSKEIGTCRDRGEQEAVRPKRARTSASYLLAADDVLRYERIHLQPAARTAPQPRAAAARASTAATLRARWRRKRRTCAKGAKGPFFAEYDLTVAAAGEYQLDLLEEETGAGHGRRAGQRRPGAARASVR